MPDTPVDRSGPDPYDPGVEPRLSRVEDEMREVKGILGQIVPLLARIDATLTSTLPHLATKAELTTLKSEFTAGLAATRSEFAAALGATREEFAAALGATRQDFAAGLNATRTEITAELGAIRADLAGTKTDLVATRAELTGAITNLRAEMHAGLAEKPSKAYLWGVLGVLVAATVASYGAGLAAIALR